MHYIFAQSQITMLKRTVLPNCKRRHVIILSQVKNMAASKAVGVLVYASAGQPIKDMNCIGEECYTALGIPAAMVHLETSVDSTLRYAFLILRSFCALSQSLENSETQEIATYCPHNVYSSAPLTLSHQPSKT